MAEFNGMDGSLTWAAGWDTAVKQWSVTDEITLGRTLNFDSADDYEKILAGGPKRWSGSIVADFNSGVTMPTPGDRGNATLLAKAGSGWEGEIVLERIENSVAKTADVIEVTFSFQGSGAPTRPS